MAEERGEQLELLVLGVLGFLGLFGHGCGLWLGWAMLVDCERGGLEYGRVSVVVVTSRLDWRTDDVRYLGM